MSEPWTNHLTDFAIKMMRECTQVPFELVIVEVSSELFKERADVHLTRSERFKVWPDFNAGIDASSGDFIVHIGNDVIVQPGWLEALIEPFAKYKDCGVSSLAAVEGGGVAIGPRTPMKLIVESIYAPIMMFRREWKFDEAYPGMYGDADLVLRMYDAGLRAYRNCAVVVYHFHGATTKTSLNPEKDAHEKAIGLKLMHERLLNSPYLMVRMILNGHAIWGREHEV